MNHYRLYYLRDEHITKAVVLECETDEQAMELAQGHCGPYALELWQGARRVGRFERQPR